MYNLITCHILLGNRTSDIAYYLKYSGERGNRGPDYDMSYVVESPAGLRLSKINCLVSKEDCMDTLTAYNLFYNIRSRSKIDNKCSDRIFSSDPNSRYECFDEYCLFDIQQDPCEYQNLAKHNQQILNITIDLLKQFKKEMIKQNIPDIDPNADPRYFNGYWDNWMENSGSNSSQNYSYMTIPIYIFFILYRNTF